MQSKVKIDSLTKRFGATTALADITLDVIEGRKTVVIGPAASGKTVLLKCIAGIYRPEAGKIAISGVEVLRAGSPTHTDLMQSVGVLFQQGGLFDSMPVWKNISFKLTQTRGIDDVTARRGAIEKLEMVNLPASTADLFPAELSGGMQKRVGIARALAGDPKLLLLDEPTAGLDPITTSAINRLIDVSQRELDATVLSITSDMRSARENYEYMLMLHEGQLVWNGKTADIEASGNPYLLQIINGKAAGPIIVPGQAVRE